MSEEEWRLEVSGILGEVKNELENNRINHEKVSACLKDVEEALSGLPCTKNTADLATLKTKFSKPYLIGILVIALIPILFLFLKVRALNIDFIKEAQALQKTQIIFEKFIKKNGHLLVDDDLRLIKEGGEKN